MVKIGLVVILMTLAHLFYFLEKCSREPVLTVSAALVVTKDQALQYTALLLAGYIVSPML